ncbi:helix-turn-helix domain-containing protein [Cohnella cellulosilytica]|uniref:Helix-turn-helix domain-containing protein n=1 Tax=Cohnella cellulosilytica TaxID=986710 RepID=A0ABW2F953_9BACL
MFSLIIVDDEEILREGLKEAVPWESWGFRVAALAASGEEGLELFESIRPDVLLTDIKMYAFSGLDLLKAAKEIRPQCEVVLLSGYEEFSFAKQGLELGASAYVLKLNLFDELEETFAKLRCQLDARQEEERRRKEAERENAAAELVKRLRGETSPGEGLSGFYSVATIGAASEERNRLLPEAEKIAAGCGWRVVPIGTKYVAVCIPHVRAAESPEALRTEIHSRLRRLTEPYPDAIAGIGSIVRGAEIEVSYRQAMKMVDYGRLHGGGWGFVYDEIASSLAGEPLEAPKYEDIRLWIDLNRADELLQALERYLTAVVNHLKFAIPDVRLVAMNVLMGLNNRMKESGVETDPDSEIDVLVAALNRMDSIADIRDWLFEVVRRLTGSSVHAERDNGDLFEQAIRLIDRNYQNDISLQGIAQSMYVSPSYFSAKFKEAAGVNFVDYVKRKRVDQAAALLVGTNKKIADIAKEVGYADEKYFSRVFKRVKQLSPQQFREENIRSDQYGSI